MRNPIREKKKKQNQTFDKGFFCSQLLVRVLSKGSVVQGNFRQRRKACVQVLQLGVGGGGGEAAAAQQQLRLNDRVQIYSLNFRAKKYYTPVKGTRPKRRRQRRGSLGRLLKVELIVQHFSVLPALVTAPRNCRSSLQAQR